MKCGNFTCRKEFEPTRKGQKYCCPRCQNHAAYSKRVKSGKQQANAKKYYDEHPEAKYKAAAARYRSGKLPKWMFS